MEPEPQSYRVICDDSAGSSDENLGYSQYHLDMNQPTQEDKRIVSLIPNRSPFLIDALTCLKSQDCSQFRSRVMEKWPSTLFASKTLQFHSFAQFFCSQDANCCGPCHSMPRAFQRHPMPCCGVANISGTGKGKRFAHAPSLAWSCLPRDFSPNETAMSSHERPPPS